MYSWHNRNTMQYAYLRGIARWKPLGNPCLIAFSTAFVQMDYDETSARKLLEELDEDKSGLIDFQEFCAFIARIKCVGNCR